MSVRANWIVYATWLTRSKSRIGFDKIFVFVSEWSVFMKTLQMNLYGYGLQQFQLFS